MRTHPLTRLVLFLFAAVVILAACESTEESSTPLGFQDVVWQNAPVYIPGDGRSQVEMTVTVFTTEGKRVQNVAVDFTTTAGTLFQQTVITDANGEAINYLTAELITDGLDVTAEVRGAIGDTSGAVVLPKSGRTVPVEPAPEGAVAIVSARPLTDEEANARLHAIMLRRAGEQAQERQRGLSGLLGAPQGGSAAGADASEAERLTVIMEAIEILFSSDATQLTADGISTADLQARVRTITRGLGLTGVQVDFAAVYGLVTPAAFTDQFGIASARLTSAITTATADTVTATLVPQIEMEVVQPYVQPLLSLVASDANMPADGLAETEIRARLLSPTGNPVIGAKVDFSMTSGPADAVLAEQGTGTTNEDGEAVALLKAGQTSGTAVIEAKFSTITATISVVLRDIVLTVTSTPSSLVANGSNKSTINVLVTEAVTNTAVPNTTVQFSTTLGSIPPAATTNASGVASAQLTAGTTSGTATVTATLGSRSNTATVNMLPPDLTVTLMASSTTGTILRDNIDSVNLTVTVQDPDGKFLNNLTASWSASAGTIFPSTGQTGADGSQGRHTTTLTSNAGAADLTSTVTVTVGDSSRSTDIIFRGITLLPIGVQPDTILANGTVGQFTWQAVETTTGVLIKSHDVTITKQSGPSVVMSSVSNVTDSGGIARASATSTSSAGSLVLRAALGGVTQDQTLVILADQLDVVLSSDEPVLLRDGVESTRLTATVSDRFGDPVANQRVDFVLVGDGTLDRPFARTDATGDAWVTLTTDVSGTNSNAQVTASSGTASDVLNIPLFGVQLSITANPATIVADRSESAVIEATLKETGGNTPLVGRVITFSVTPGTFGSIIAQATTDGQGIATATMTADTTASFASTVTARLGNDPSTLLTASTTVNITAPSLSVTFPTALRGGPILRNGLDSSTLTIRVLGNGQPLSGKVVDWSITAGNGTLSVGSGLTNSSGEATVILTGDTGTTDVTTTVQADVDGTTATLDVTLQGISMQLTATPDTRTANGTSTSTVKAVLFRTTANTPIADQEITFSTTLGTVIGQQTTNSNGEATVTFTAGTTAGTATITSSYRAFLTDSATITLLPSVPFALAMEADPVDLIADGEGTPTTSTITVTVLDTLGAPVPQGTSVNLSVSPAGVFGNNAASVTKTTDSGGQVTAIYRSGISSGTMEFTATAGTITVVDELIHVASGLPDHILIGDPSTATDIGGGQASFTIGVTVASATNAAIEGVVINFALTGAGNDTVATITSGANTVTDENGVATATITYPLGQAGNAIEITVTTGDGSITEVKTITLPTP